MEIGNYSSFKNELSSRDYELLRYPQRIFEFFTLNFDILIDQSTNTISTIVWDSEVILSHYIESLNDSKADILIKNKLVLELGAGTALAGIVIGKIGGIIYIHELEEIINETKQRLEQNQVIGRYLSGKWNEELIRKIQEETAHNLFDLIIMSDVLYQTEYFNDLYNVILNSSKIGTEVIITYEVRRLDLTSFFERLSTIFQIEKIICYEVEKQITNDDDVDLSTTQQPTTSITKFYLHHLRRVE